ncbi:MAG: FAD binding domain-containing protein [Chloroflexi bacterium]|nr:FAD binding domain-containing protein [Chloroflexota bacterium]
MTTKTYYQPRSLDEALSLLAQHGPALLVIAGGTLAMPLINEGVSMPEQAMGLRRAGLNLVHRADGHLTIGATATLTQMAEQQEIPLLAEAAHSIGGWAIRNMGTVGGNLFAPPPAGDLAAALLALDATVTLADRGGRRTLPLSEFFTGFMMNVLRPGELVVGFDVPIPTGKTAFLRYGRKQANTPAIVTVAAHLVMAGQTVKQARIALNAVGPHPLRARNAEAALAGRKLDEVSIGAAAVAATEECEPFTDAIATEWYRRKMVGVYVRRALEQIA